MKILIFILLLLISFCSCKKEDEQIKKQDTEIKSSDNNNLSEESALKFEDRNFYKSYNNCESSDTCAIFKADYIEAVSGSNKDKINKLIQRELIKGISFDDKPASSLESSAENFMKMYAEQRKEFPESPASWYFEYTFNTASETEKTITFISAVSTYMGGAHPSSNLFYINIDKRTGDTISLNNLFAPGFEKELNKLIDSEFRKANNLKPGDNLAEKGFLFENKINFNYNFMIRSDKSITFYYNQYDIAPYAAGPIEVTLSYDQIKPLLSENSLLK